MGQSQIEKAFNSYFHNWGIRLPRTVLVSLQRGEIREAGWHIQYLFGRDEGGDYLDFYASHRMTNDRHVRIRADGTQEDLPAIEEWLVYSKEATQAEQKLAKTQLLARNRQVLEDLKRKGFA